jgi:hypothetical protein
MSDPGARPARDGEGEDFAPLQGLRNWLRGLRRGRNGEASLRDAIEELIEESEAEPDAAPIGRDEGSLLLNILKLGDLTAYDIMVPRADIIAVPVVIRLPPGPRPGLAGPFALPVFRETLGDVVGAGRSQDATACVASVATARASPRGAVRRPSMHALDLLPAVNPPHGAGGRRVQCVAGWSPSRTWSGRSSGEIEDEHDVAEAEAHPATPTLMPARDRVRGEGRAGADYEAEREQDIDTLAGLVVSLTRTATARPGLIQPSLRPRPRCSTPTRAASSAARATLQSAALSADPVVARSPGRIGIRRSPGRRRLAHRARAAHARIQGAPGGGPCSARGLPWRCRSTPYRWWRYHLIWLIDGRDAYRRAAVSAGGAGLGRCRRILLGSPRAAATHCRVPVG